MSNTKKRLALLAAAVMMTASVLTGCQGSIDDNATVITVGEEKVPMRVANFFARYQQAMAESQYSAYFGEDFWGMSITSDGDTLEADTKKSILEDLKELYVLEDHMGDYGIEITAEEEAKIEETAKAFVENNDADDKEAVSGDEETVARVLELVTIQEKMRREMIADVDTEVSDEEAAQKSMQYVFFTFTKSAEDGTTSTMTDEEKAELKKTAEEFLVGAKAAEDFAAYAEEQGYTATTKTFDAEATSPSEELIQAADTLKEGEFTDIVEVETGYYAAKLLSEFDREATDAKKETIVSERQNARYKELLKEFVESAEITVNNKEWEKISFTKQRVSAKQPETESTENSGE